MESLIIARFGTPFFTFAKSINIAEKAQPSSHPSVSRTSLLHNSMFQRGGSGCSLEAVSLGAPSRLMQSLLLSSDSFIFYIEKLGCESSSGVQFNSILSWSKSVVWQIPPPPPAVHSCSFSLVSARWWIGSVKKKKNQSSFLPWISSLKRCDVWPHF